MTNLVRVCRVGALALITALAAFQTANAATATSLSVGFCSVTRAPCPQSNPQVIVGQPFYFWVVALDANSGFATDYTSTITITTNAGVVATLPPPQAASDNAILEFSATIDQLPTGSGNPALVTIVATDSNGLTASMQIPLGAPQQTIVSTPALLPIAELTLAGVLGALGLVALRKRRRAQ
jgi:hypothetical protein